MPSDVNYTRLDQYRQASGVGVVIRPEEVEVRVHTGIVAAVGAALLLGGCGAASSTPPSSSSASSASSSSTAVASTVAWHPSSSCHTTNPFVEQAIKNVEAWTVPDVTWYGPTSGPKLKAGTSVVFIPTDSTNILSYTWGEDILAIAKKIGWTATMIDGKGSTQGWEAAMTEAIALKPNVIMTSADIPTIDTYVKQAVALGIGVIGLHGTSFAGPSIEEDEYTNITTDPVLVGQAMADYAIADSCGTAKVIIEYDSTYEVAVLKAETMKGEIEKCTTCKVLAYVDSPLSQASTLEPGLCSSWVSQYGLGWYAMSNADDFWDYCAPALKAAGVADSAVHLIGCDGTSTAYQRMRTDEYQVASVPEPAEFQAYAAINDANNYVQGLSASYGTAAGEWTQPVYMVYSESGQTNVNAAGGAQGQYYPNNNYAQRFLTLWGVSS